MQCQRDFWDWSRIIARLASSEMGYEKLVMLEKGDDEGEGGSERIPRKVYTVYNTRSSKAWSRGRWSSKGRVEKNLIFPRIILFGNNGFTSRIVLPCHPRPPVLALSPSLSLFPFPSFSLCLSSLVFGDSSARKRKREKARKRETERAAGRPAGENGSPTRRQRKKSRNSKSWIVVTERHSSWYTGCDYIFPSFRLN